MQIVFAEDETYERNDVVVVGLIPGVLAAWVWRHAAVMIGPVFGVPVGDGDGVGVGVAVACGVAVAVGVGVGVDPGVVGGSDGIGVADGACGVGEPPPPPLHATSAAPRATTPARRRTNTN
jgi:hypothetical protein